MANVCTCEKGGKQGGVVLLRLSCLSIVENWEVVVVAGKEGRRLALDRMREVYDGSFARFRILSYPSQMARMRTSRRERPELAEYEV